MIVLRFAEGDSNGAAHLAPASQVLPSRPVGFVGAIANVEHASRPADRCIDRRNGNRPIRAPDSEWFRLEPEIVHAVAGLTKAEAFWRDGDPAGVGPLDLRCGIFV